MKKIILHIFSLCVLLSVVAAGMVQYCHHHHFHASLTGNGIECVFASHCCESHPAGSSDTSGACALHLAQMNIPADVKVTVYGFSSLSYCITCEQTCLPPLSVTSLLIEDAPAAVASARLKIFNETVFTRGSPSLS
ncbi:MAG: hypothetical protein J6C77_00120 [Muribaculaceae bacterium]|nr:hypothetical protein [Muribaculaceae bacterium]